MPTTTMMLRSIVLSIAAMALCLGNSWAFTAPGGPSLSTRSSTALDMAGNKGQKAMAGAVAAGLLLANVMTTDPAMAMPAAPDFGSSIVVSPRMGGRMGGRAPRMMSAPRGGYSSARSYSRTTIVRPMIAPPIISPFGSPFGYGMGYNPLGGFGLGYGLGAVNSAGNAARDYRQEAEIQQSKAELEQAEKKNVELEQRIKALEQQQGAAPQAPAVAQ